MTAYFVTNGIDGDDVDSAAEAFQEVRLMNDARPKYPYYVMTDENMGVAEHDSCPHADLIGKAYTIPATGETATVINSAQENPLNLMRVQTDKGREFNEEAAFIRSQPLVTIEFGKYVPAQ